MKKKSWVKEGEKNLPQVILNCTWKEQQETNLRDFSVNKNIIKNACEGVMTSPPPAEAPLWESGSGSVAVRPRGSLSPEHSLNHHSCFVGMNDSTKEKEGEREGERDCRFHHFSRFQAWSNLHFKPLGPVNQPLCVFTHASGAFQRWLGKVS